MKEVKSMVGAVGKVAVLKKHGDKRMRRSENHFNKWGPIID
jgi:hypothetical protein